MSEFSTFAGKFLRNFCCLMIAIFISRPAMLLAQDLREVEITIPKGSASKSKTIFCSGNIPGSGKAIAGEVRFTPFAEVIRKLKKKNSTQNKISEYKTLLSLGKSECRKSPATGTPENSPPATPTPSSTSNFDRLGNLTDKGKTSFGVPANLNGNISLGKEVYNSYCTGCHEEKRTNNFSSLRVLIAQSPMLYDQDQIPDSYLANLIAYLNRFSL